MSSSYILPSFVFAKQSPPLAWERERDLTPNTQRNCVENHDLSMVTTMEMDEREVKSGGEKGYFRTDEQNKRYFVHNFRKSTEILQKTRI